MKINILPYKYIRTAKLYRDQIDHLLYLRVSTKPYYARWTILLGDVLPERQEFVTHMWLHSINYTLDFYYNGIWG
jgi:hypothetical protein